MFTRPTIRLANAGRRHFSSTSVANGKSAALTLAGCTSTAYVLSEYVFTDDRLASWGVFNALEQAKTSLRNTIGGMTMVALPRVDAFSTPDSGLHAHSLPWESEKWTKTFDHAAIRRGYQVYKEVCAACHSMSGIAFRNLVGVAHTENEMKEFAGEYEYTDGPNDVGEMFTRPGKLTDYFPKPYPNEEASRAANGGAYPPDLTLIIKARHSGKDYVFNLLTGYSEPPAGITLREGLHYNAYFPGGAIAMAAPLYDGSVDYEDGTPNNRSQLAKDVVEFLSWAAEPEMDERKKAGWKFLALTSMLLGFTWYWKRFKWSIVKSRKLVYKRPVVGDN